MKNTVLLIILVTLVSCKQKFYITESQNYFSKGMESLQKLDTLGKPDYQRALIYFDSCVLLNPRHTHAMFWKSTCEFNLGKFDQSLQTSLLAINKIGNSDDKLLPFFYISAGLIEKINKNITKANEYFEKSNIIYDKRLKSDKNDIDAIMNKALNLCHMGRKNEAIIFVNSISVSNDKIDLLLQIRKYIPEYDADAFLNNIKTTCGNKQKYE